MCDVVNPLLFQFVAHLFHFYRISTRLITIIKMNGSYSLVSKGCTDVEDLYRVHRLIYNYYSNCGKLL